MEDIVNLDFEEQCILLNKNKELFNDCLDILQNTNGYEQCDETDFNLIKDVLNTFYLQDYEKYFVDSNYNIYELVKGKYCLVYNSEK